MKDTYKIFKLRDKMKDPPPVPLFTRFFNGEQVLKPKEIKELKKVVDKEYNSAVSFLNKELEKLNNNGTTTSGR